MARAYINDGAYFTYVKKIIKNISNHPTLRYLIHIFNIYIYTFIHIWIMDNWICSLRYKDLNIFYAII